MSWRKPPDGLQTKAEHAFGTMRDISTRLREIAKRLTAEQSEELEFVAKLLDREADLLVVQSATGDLASTGWASKIANIGISFAVGILGNLSTPIVQSGGEQAYRQLTEICEQAANEVSEIGVQVVGQGANEVHRQLDDLQKRLVTFTSAFSTTRGTEIFPPSIYDATAGTETIMSDVLTTVHSMREWLARDERHDPPDLYLPDSRESVASELKNADIQLQRVSALRQFLAEESAEREVFQGVAANPTATVNVSTGGTPTSVGAANATARASVSTSGPARSLQEEARTDDSVG